MGGQDLALHSQQARSLGNWRAREHSPALASGDTNFQGRLVHTFRKSIGVGTPSTGMVAPLRSALEPLPRREEYDAGKDEAVHAEERPAAALKHRRQQPQRDQSRQE